MSYHFLWYFQVNQEVPVDDSTWSHFHDKEILSCLLELFVLHFTEDRTDADEQTAEMEIKRSCTRTVWWIWTVVLLIFQLLSVLMRHVSLPPCQIWEKNHLIASFSWWLYGDAGDDTMCWLCLRSCPGGRIPNTLCAAVCDSVMVQQHMQINSSPQQDEDFTHQLVFEIIPFCMEFYK